MEVLQRVARELKARETTGDDKIVKISVVGVGMRSHAGIASQMFKALADEGINIQMISTSEIKVSVVVEEKYLNWGYVRSITPSDSKKTPSQPSKSLPKLAQKLHSYIPAGECSGGARIYS